MVAEAALVEAAPAAPLVAVKKFELIQLAWHEAYAAVSSSVPLPWTHRPAHSVVALTWASLGQGTLTQAAWQQISAAAPIHSVSDCSCRRSGRQNLQAARQVAWGLRDVDVEEAATRLEAAEDAEL